MKSSYLGEREVKAVSLGGALSGGVSGGRSSRFHTLPSPAASVLVSEAPIVGAIVDKSICIAAQFFIGWPGSTFANTLVYSRILAGHARKSNWYYNLADGVRRRDDDGRGGPQAPVDVQR